MGLSALVVDAVLPRARKLGQRVSEQGWRVALAPTADAALEALARDDASLVLVDGSLEDMPLHRFARCAKHLRASCTIVVCFDRSLPSRPRGMWDPHIDDVLPYECGHAALCDVIGRALVAEGASVGARPAPKWLQDPSGHG